ncbi:MAG: PD-(D/E)XK nuclease family protein [Chloroflexi bacterium]|nr:PD-(D/E)XK nuclease family protein [Chloroflexota bacterium]
MSIEPGRFRQVRDKEQTSKNIDNTGDGLIPVHWLHTHAYCEFQLYLEKALGVEAKPTIEMLAGAQQHAFLDAEHVKKAEVELTIDEAAAKAQLEAVTLVSRDVSVRGMALYGRIDEVVFEPNRIVIIDDKPSAQPYFTNKIQVWGYCQAFMETYRPKIPLFAALRQEDNGNMVWLEQYLDEHSILVANAVERIRGIMTGKESPQAAGNSRKCQPCRFKETCPAHVT